MRGMAAWPSPGEKSTHAPPPTRPGKLEPGGATHTKQLRKAAVVPALGKDTFIVK